MRNIVLPHPCLIYMLSEGNILNHFQVYQNATSHNSHSHTLTRAQNQKKRKRPVIVKTYLNYSSNPQIQHFGLFCKYQPLKSFCLRDRGRLGNEGQPILLKMGTQSRYVGLCNMPEFQPQRLFSSRVMDISPSGVLKG